MRCPFCGHGDTTVKDSRSTEENAGIRRRRHCPDCQGRFTTVERVQLIPLKVLKKDGSVKPFDREKMAHSLELALHKRPVDAERRERVVSSIVRQLETRGESDIPTKVIGEMVMEALSELDKVAFVRFASVYKDFDSPEDFMNFVERLNKLQITKASQ